MKRMKFDFKLAPRKKLQEINLWPKHESYNFGTFTRKHGRILFHIVVSKEYYAQKVLLGIALCPPSQILVLKS